MIYLPLLLGLLGCSDDGKCEVTLTLDLKEGTLKFAHAGRSIGTIAGIKGPLHAAVTITSSRQSVSRPAPRQPPIRAAYIGSCATAGVHSWSLTQPGRSLPSSHTRVRAPLFARTQCAAIPRPGHQQTPRPYAPQATLTPGPIGKSEHTNEELVNILKVGWMIGQAGAGGRSSMRTAGQRQAKGMTSETP